MHLSAYKLESNTLFLKFTAILTMKSKRTFESNESYSESVGQAHHRNFTTFRQKPNYYTDRQCWPIGQCWSVLNNLFNSSILRKHLVIGQFSFLCFSLVAIRVVNLPERTETGLITASDQTVRAVHSCNCWLYTVKYLFGRYFLKFEDIRKTQSYH